MSWGKVNFLGQKLPPRLVGTVDPLTRPLGGRQHPAGEQGGGRGRLHGGAGVESLAAPLREERHGKGAPGPWRGPFLAIWAAGVPIPVGPEYICCPSVTGKPSAPPPTASIA